MPWSGSSSELGVCAGGDDGSSWAGRFRELGVGFWSVDVLLPDAPSLPDWFGPTFPTRSSPSV